MIGCVLRLAQLASLGDERPEQFPDRLRVRLRRLDIIHAAEAIDQDLQRKALRLAFLVEVGTVDPLRTSVACIGPNFQEKLLYADVENLLINALHDLRRQQLQLTEGMQLV